MIASLIAASLLLLVGAVILSMRKSVSAPARLQIPKVWPLLARPLVNSKERKIWSWLKRVMHDQEIMVKLPVTRFTIPAQREGAEHWYAMLNKVYCTFTICGRDGRVIGCVDVPGNAGLSMSNQTLKYGLLSQCGIPYWVVEPDNLPHMSQIRTAFLGDSATQADVSRPMDTQFKDVAGSLQATVLRQRSNKAQSPARDVNGFEPTEIADHGPLTQGWEQNSFMAPMDSRAGDLRRNPK